MKNKKGYINVNKGMDEERRRLAASKTKEDLNDLFKGRSIVVKNGSDWDNELCEFVEMVGEGAKENWKMKVKTKFGTFLELAGGEAIIVTQTIKTTRQEAELIRKNLQGE